ncbi:hypothetical protein B0H10DRAFT_2066499 [Mycena sp. CBHHK59/15]|nr:hypothetical protein B0H10DRAFT_2066499 [Mycena sp. CBHHK59/15]
MVYLDDHVLDRLCSARHNIGELGPEAYVIETNPMGEQVLRLPGIDSIVDQMIDEWGYVPFSSTNSMDLPECTKFFQDLYQAWNYLPQRIDRAAVVAQLRIAIDFPGAAPHIQIPAPSNPEDQEWERLGVPQTLIHSMFTATRKPFETPKAVQQYPTRRNGAPATTDDGNEIPIRRRSPLPWDFDRNSPSMVAFAGYLDEEVFDHIWTIRRAIGNGGCQYPDISDTSNQAHHLEDLGNDHYELRVPGFDNLCEALRDHWNYRVLSPFFR